MNRTGKTKIDVAKLQVQMDDVRNDILEIKSNHLPHIYGKLDNMEEKIDDLGKKVAYYAGAIGIVTAIIEYLILHK